jgi:putative tricarboxylic transport membrane protein
MKFNDAVIGAFFILFGALLFYMTRDFPILTGQDYGARLFPRVIGALMALSGAMLIPHGLRMHRDGAPWAEALEWIRSPRAVASFLLVIAILIFYIQVSDRLGFLITGFVSLFVLLVWLRGLSTALSSALISLATVLVIQAFFGQMLRVPLPWGVLQNYAW